jgi:hypothetical protein
VGTRADRFNLWLDLVHDPDYFEADLGRYSKVAGADIATTINTWLPKDKRVVTYVVPTKDAPRAGRLAVKK